MNLIVWGTGNLYKRYKDILFKFNIIKFCDNDLEKQGTILDGIEVISPLALKQIDFTYVIVMSYALEAICQQLDDLGVAKDQIILHTQLCVLRQPEISVHSMGYEVSLDEWIEKNQNCILLISHNFSYTGIPVAVKNMAHVLKKMGYSVLIAAMEGGPFTKELERQKMEYIDDLGLCYQSQYFKEILQIFKAVVIGSFSLSNLVKTLVYFDIPVLWWVHETSDKYYMGENEVPVGRNIRFFAGGNRVKEIFSNHYKNVEIETLQYCIPDSYDNVNCTESDYMAIAVIGTIDKRKAQDILLEAITRMPRGLRVKLKVIFVGQLDENDIMFADKIMVLQNQIDNFEWIPEMTREEINKFYYKIDVLVCPSREDPMPMVVTEAMMHERVCVISENVGQAEFIEQGLNGFIFPNEDVDMLMEILIWLINNKSRRTIIGKASRKIYEDEFSEEIMQQRIKGILSEVISK
mgnify:CR=1 FL=1